MMNRLTATLRFAFLVLMTTAIVSGLSLNLRKASAQDPKVRKTAVQRNPSMVENDDSLSPEAATVTRTKSGVILINDNSTSSPYPSTLTVSGITPEIITKVRVVISGLTHAYLDDVDIILIGPQGQRSILMSDAGGSGGVSNIILGFDSTSANVLQDHIPPAAGTYRPVNYVGNGDNFPSPGPGNVGELEPADLSVFNGTNPNGDWNLFIVDDQAQDSGFIQTSWSLEFTVPTVFTVTKTADTNDGVCDAADCSLREAIALAQNGDLINFSSLFNTPQTITLGGTELLVNKNVYIKGPGADKLTISGNDQSRVFNIGNGFNVTLDGLTISNGQEFNGGGIINNGTTTITNSTISDNSAFDFGGGIYNVTGTTNIVSTTISNNISGFGGGGITNSSGTTTITNSTISNNSALDLGGGISNSAGTTTITNTTISNNSAEANGGGINNLGTTTITNTTISNNSATNVGGGIRNRGTTTITNTTISNNSATTVGGGIYNSDGTTTMTNSTISNNLAINQGGGIYNSNGVVLSSRNTIIANNTAPIQPDFRGDLNSNGYNLIGNAANVTINGDTTGNQLNVDPKLTPLGNYGGTTQTHALLFGSPALDKGHSSGSTTDQRGLSRPFDISGTSPAPGGDNADIGAFEAQAVFVANTGDNGSGSLRQTIIDSPPGTDIYLNAATPLIITLTTGQLLIDKDINILSTGPNLLTISGNNQSRIFNIVSGVTVGLSGMTVTNGKAQNGGGIFNEGNLTISNLTVNNNVADDSGAGAGGGGGGGGIYNSNSGKLSITASKITDSNARFYSGGGINNFGILKIKETTVDTNFAQFGGGIANTGDLTIVNSTISNNTATAGSFGGGGIEHTGTLSITNSTVSGNAANNGHSSAGGILTGLSSATSTTIVNTTITNNSASGGGNSVGGVYRLFGTVTVRNSIIAGNASNTSIPDVSGIFVSTGFNLVGNVGTSTGFSQPTDQTGTVGTPLNPGLAPLADNGGPTQTHALLGGSPALDKGHRSGSDTDQRGLPRRFDIGSIPPANGGDNSDIGAFEAQTAPATPTISVDDVSQNEGNSGTTNFTFTVSLSAASSQTVTVSYQTANGTATAGSDYIGVGATTLTFNPGETSKPVTVLVNGDTVVEPDENFFVNLSSPTNATIADGQGEGTIVNDDAACSYTLSPASPQSVGAAQSNLNVTVTTTASCMWTAATSTSWITINSGQSGTGSGTVNMTFAANTGAARSGSLTIAGQTYTINQASGSTTCPSPVPISLGQKVSGTLQAGDCTYTDNSFYDAYTFSGRAGQKIYAAMNSSQFDTYLLLYQGNYPGGQLINQNNNGGGGTNSRIPATSGYITLPATGTYTVLANSFTAGLTGAYEMIVGTPTQFDFDGDGKTDIGIFRPAPGEWWYLRSSDNGNFAAQFGSSADKLVPGDYTGDGKADIAFFRPSTGEWFVLRSENSSFYSFPFGNSSDIPAPADYDGDGKVDPAIFRPSEGNWYILRSSDNGTTIQQFGSSGDKPVPADYDGDGKADLAIFRPDGSWWLNRSQAGVVVATFGVSTDKTVPGDFTGDGKADVAFFRPSTNEWFILRSEDSSFYSFPFGASGDIPAPGDYDGDGKFDSAVFRPSNSTWYLLRSTAGSVAIGFGAPNDVPISNAFVR